MNILDRVSQRLERGLPLEPEPYALVAKELGVESEQVLAAIQTLVEENVIRRFGIVVHHKTIGFKANAMCVWDIPDEKVSELGHQLTQFDFVTLCYQRRREDGVWPYNLYCMIHGVDQKVVLDQYHLLNRILNLSSFKSKVLFSTKAFKQRGARYSSLSENSERKILNKLQDGIAIESQPYRLLAAEFGLTEEEILLFIQKKLDDGSLTRFGPMYNVEKFGGQFTLVAMKVPKERFEEVTHVVNSHPEVAHNYKREHLMNMWFVTATETSEETVAVLANIEQQTGLKTYAMPKLEEYYLDLRFRL